MTIAPRHFHDVTSKSVFLSYTIASIAFMSKIMRGASDTVPYTIFMYRLEGLRVLLRVAVPLALGVDMLHSFYFVGCLIKEAHALEAERYRIRTLHATGTLFKTVISISTFSTPTDISFLQISMQCSKTDFSFWPPSIMQSIQMTPLPDLSSLPRPSYELEDEEESSNDHKTSVHQLRSFPDEASPTGQQPLLRNGDGISTDGDVEGVEGVEVESVGSKGMRHWYQSFNFDVTGATSALYECIVPYPIRHPRRFLKAVKAEIQREVRLHLKKSEGYFESKGMWLRGMLHLPYLVIERRSALRFRLRIIPVSQIGV